MNVKAGEEPARSGGRKAEQSEATRAALVSAGRRLFGERGYAAVGTEEVVRAAGVTRGALYHHFGGKSELLDAVYRQLEEEITAKVAELALGSGAGGPLESMRAGISVFIETCSEPEVERIVLLDGPSVLGWDRCREIAVAYGLGLIESSLEAAIEAGEIPAQPVKPLAHVLIGALDEAAMLVARSEDPGAREEVTAVLERLLDSLRSPAR
jgi:AcrR family transcriptional regulator